MQYMQTYMMMGTEDQGSGCSRNVCVFFFLCLSVKKKKCRALERYFFFFCFILFFTIRLTGELHKYLS